jgi:hypothetical protein
LVQETDKRGFRIEWIFCSYSKSKEITEYEFTYRRIIRCKQFCDLLQKTPDFTTFVEQLKWLEDSSGDIQLIDSTINNFDIKSSTEVYPANRPFSIKESPFSNLSVQVRL